MSFADFIAIDNKLFLNNTNKTIFLEATRLLCSLLSTCNINMKLLYIPFHYYKF